MRQTYPGRGQRQDVGLRSSPIWETARAVVPSARYEGATLETSQLSPQCCVCLLLAAFPGAHLRLWVPAPITVGEENPRRHPLHTGELVCRKTHPALFHSGGRTRKDPIPHLRSVGGRGPRVWHWAASAPEADHVGEARVQVHAGQQGGPGLRQTQVPRWEAG